MKILLADDHTLFLQGLVSLIEKNKELKIVGEASNGSDAITLAEELDPDIVIMDISMPQTDGIQATEIIIEKNPHIKVIILSMYSQDNYVLNSLKAGASAYVLKNAAYQELQLAIDAVAEGETYLSPGVSQVVIKKYLQLTSDNESLEKYYLLTSREQEIIRLMGEGYKRQEIATELVISPKTVDRHQENMKERLGFKRRSDLIPFASTVKTELEQVNEEKEE